MKNLKMKTSLGQEIELTEADMSIINQHYEVQSTADYLRDKYPNWNEDKIQEIAEDAREQMADYGFSEDEAIEEAIDEYDEEYAADNEDFF